MKSVPFASANGIKTDWSATVTVALSRLAKLMQARTLAVPIPSVHADRTESIIRMVTKTRAKKTAKSTRTNTICHGARATRMPSEIQPMLATLVDEPFSDPDWIFETK